MIIHVKCRICNSSLQMRAYPSSIDCNIVATVEPCKKCVNNTVKQKMNEVVHKVINTGVPQGA